jgi:hypothetical protein
MPEQNIEKLLERQTKVILDAVDAKLSINQINVLAGVDKRLEVMEMRINRNIEKLTTTLDKFLKRMTDMEDEFTIMKHDLDRVKKVIREKLGVDLA